jgi:hypothetical protein
LAVFSDIIDDECAVDDEDGGGDNDGFCFGCRTPGNIICCEYCPRSLHRNCFPGQRVDDTDVWMCPFCSSESRDTLEKLRSYDSSGYNDARFAGFVGIGHNVNTRL